MLRLDLAAYGPASRLARRCGFHTEIRIAVLFGLFERLREHSTRSDRCSRFAVNLRRRIYRQTVWLYYLLVTSILRGSTRQSPSSSGKPLLWP